ncbi:MAG: serine acetyltransferase [Thermoanaerobaculia bacterium]|nr:serine acetyltransferase [Thermoanaerobaculia bacterium]
MSLCPRFRRDLGRLREIKGWGPVRAFLDAVLLDSAFQALMWYRIGSACRRGRIPLLPAVCRRVGVAFSGADILPTARIGAGCYLVHGVGLVIGGGSVVGEDCTILHGVTLGEGSFDDTACPTVGDRVTIGVGAKVLGGVTVGDGAFIGAGAVVLDDVPAGHVAVGMPATSRPIAPAADPG